MTSRRAGILTLGGAVVVVTAAVLWRPSWIIRWLGRRHPEVLYYVNTTQKVLALTIDDGPIAGTTERILDTLGKHGAHATFFVIGEQIAGNEQILQRLTMEGHEIGNHMMRDEPTAKLGSAEFRSQLAETDRMLRPFDHSCWLRPGSGGFTPDMISESRAQGYRIVLGSIYPFDPHHPFAGLSARFIQANVSPGGIIILHDGLKRGPRTVEVLETVLPKLRRAGFEIVTISELVRRAGV